MNIKSIINLKNKGIYLFKDGNDIRCRSSKRMMTDDIRNQIRQHKKEILKLLIIENPYNLPVKISKAKFTHRICHQLLKLIEGILKLLGAGNPYNSPVKKLRTKPIQDSLSTNGSMIKLIRGDCLYCLSKIEANSVDQVATDPSYGIKFMGKDWDKALPSIEIWIEVLRVLKPGAFAFIMASPRQDVLSRMIRILEEAGFVIGFTSLYWTYANGFPKAYNMAKSVGASLITDKAKKLDGSYAGFQPKPAVEVILVVMKPCEKRSYTEQALADGKGITWLDDCRIPYGTEIRSTGECHEYGGGDTTEKDWKQGIEKQAHEKGRFPANLLVSDGVICDGRKHTTGSWRRWNNGSKVFGGSKGDTYTEWKKVKKQVLAYSHYFSLDAWADLNLQNLPEKVQQNLPFFIVPKASKKEKNAGLDNMKEKKVNDGRKKENDTAFQRGATLRKNTHPTVKPLTLMSYLITMGSRPGDVVLDPFCGSGTTCIAAHKLQRRSIGIELNPEYFRIAQARLRRLVLESFRQKDTANDFSYEQSESPKKNCGRPLNLRGSLKLKREITNL